MLSIVSVAFHVDFSLLRPIFMVLSCGVVRVIMSYLWDPWCMLFPVVHDDFGSPRVGSCLDLGLPFVEIDCALLVKLSLWDLSHA